MLDYENYVRGNNLKREGYRLIKLAHNMSMNKGFIEDIFNWDDVNINNEGVKKLNEGNKVLEKVFIRNKNI